MKKFLLNTSIFVIPFILLYSFNVYYYDQRDEDGDLARMGYFYSNPSPKSLINSQYNLSKQYRLLSETNLTSKESFDVITIGDSFSEQDDFGYKNFLANKGLSVLHIDRFISGSNPLQSLVGLMNSGLFDIIHPKYIVLQSIERDINDRTKNIDFEDSIDLKQLSRKVKNHKSEAPNYNLQFFSDATLKMPLNNLQYLFADKPFFSNTYKVSTNSENLFTNNPDNLLFYKRDLQKLNAKNDSLRTLNSIKVLDKLSNLLAQIDIELIVIISPDKYDLYYPYIEDQSRFTPPVFFSIYEDAEKSYKNVDTYRLLSSRLGVEKDIYYYDDTHWSPVGANIIADEIYDLMIRNEGSK
ncbi:alginate O-acetyltransferase AlgX-related protein [Belliella aquatica]|uniref:AlgX/AlgJ SGNH hydrolase-like domain-containing protein n=1 Tax=Belliella aquatica TaxID=1323734 RepID=A0ABQ1LTG3_9BACT|nr:hypothetical protein [Belliella aquatica]MCH7404238.1 hypothetical protein [Belliella aquatica]GGC26469.1 hypothetical protein GCM10010993_01880 [Belliella aquatica]